MLSLVTVSVAAGDPYDDQLREAERRAEQAEAALAELDAAARVARDELVVLEDRLADAEGRLRTLDGQVVLAERELEERQVAADEAAAAAAAAADHLARTEAELARNERLLGDQLALAWIHGSTSRPAMLYELLQTSSSPSDVAADLYRIGTVLDAQAATVTEVELLRAEAAAAFEDARTTRLAADAARQVAADGVALVTGLRDQAAAVRAAVATDRERQAAVLAGIEADAAGVEAVLASVDAERARITAERDAAREQERRTAGTPSGGLPCPVDGAVAGRDFTNDWGHPRAGGRSHEGTDIFADRGTPVRSMTDGTVKEVRSTDSGLAGKLVSVWAADGEHWYYAHLDEVSPGLAVGVPVRSGQQIGTVGSTGNARGTPPHLHIGHYVDDVADNPYPVLEQACR